MWMNLASTNKDPEVVVKYYLDVQAGPAEQGRPGGPWPTQLQKIVLQPDGDLAELPVKGMR